MQGIYPASVVSKFYNPSTLAIKKNEVLLSYAYLSKIANTFLKDKNGLSSECMGYNELCGEVVPNG